MIPYYAAVFSGFFLFAYSLKFLRGSFFALAENSVALVNSLLSNVDEDDKVRLVQQGNIALILSLAKAILVLLFAICLGSIPLVLYSMVSGEAFSDMELTSTLSILTLSAGSTLGFVIPVGKKVPGGYSELSQLLHRLALNNYYIAGKLLKLEAKKLDKKGVSIKQDFLIVSGLARSGTTSLLNKLAQDDRFASLSYANMPFLTAPNLWAKVYNPKSDKKRERSHKDGIQIGLNSTEALEEYFFKVVCNDAYIKEHALLKHDISKEQYADYMAYQAVVRNDNSKIYLAKNNNFLLRYDSLRKLNDQFTVVFMFRDPLEHTSSLLEKHHEFSAAQQLDPFVLEYMNWLGHHEFGLDQRPFQFLDGPQQYLEDKNSLDLWLQIWIHYYSYLLTIDRSNVIFTDYARYCTHPDELISKIYGKIGLAVKVPGSKPFQNTRKVKVDCSEKLRSDAYAIYDQLLAAQ